MSKALRLLRDDLGSVVAGFLAPDVYYVRCVGFVSSGLGIRFASHLRKELGEVKSVTSFVDVSAAQGGDFAARSAVMRALLANRKHLGPMTILVTPGPIAPKARALSAMIGGVTHLLESRSIFEAQMTEAAPNGRDALPASGKVRVARSEHPRPRSVHPRARFGTHG